ncbi:MAG TPA: LacI family DNA-binding transcriptional regulator [Tepidisphaeraceae bacterium]|nr:LacI family DNA-binding transcriptional regulator [Tepidisphaeraceae bacterium]
MARSNATSSRPTLADVARRAGVSKSAVSQTINWMPNRVNTIKLETRQRILRAVEEMGYRPNWRGQVLANQRSQTVAVVYSALLGAVPRGVYWEVVDQIEARLGIAHLCPAFVHVKDHTERFSRLVGDARFDGCLTLGVVSSEVLGILRENQVPTVLVNSDADESWTRVRVNDEQGSRLLMQHFLSLGHQRIIYYAGPNPPAHKSAQIRRETWELCMRESGLTLPKPFAGPADKFVEQIMTHANSPTAVLVFDHWGAVQLLQSLWRKGIRVPQDISVATFNNTYPVAEVIPPLTTVSLPTDQMAETAVRLLLERIENADTAAQTVMLDELLIVRESTAPPRN